MKRPIPSEVLELPHQLRRDAAEVPQCDGEESAVFDGVGGVAKHLVRCDNQFQRSGIDPGRVHVFGLSCGVAFERHLEYGLVSLFVVEECTSSREDLLLDPEQRLLG